MSEDHSSATNTSAGVGENATPASSSPPVELPASSEERARLHAIAEDSYDFVWRTLRRLGLPSSAADDATQQVFIVAAKRLHEITPGAERAFLYRSASLIAMEARRKFHTREQPDEEIAEHADASPNPEELAGRKQARAILDEVLVSLDHELREVFVLFELESMPLPEIAALLGIPPGTCSSRLRRAREDFNEAVKRMKARRPTVVRRT